MADSGVNIRISATDKASAQINAVGKSLSGLSKQVGSVQSAVSSLATGGIPGLAKSLSTLSGVVSGSIPIWAGLGGIVGAAGGALITMAVSAANATEQLDNMSAQTGIAAADLEALQRISEDAGLGTESLASSLGKLNRQLASGEGGEFARVLDALGGSIKDGSGQIKDVIPLLDDLQKRLLATSDSAERARLANTALGKGMGDWIPLILSSKEKISDQIEAMKTSGRVMDEMTRQNMRALDKALDEAKADWDRLTIAIGSATGAFLNFFRVSEAPLPTMSLRELVAAMPGVPGKSRLEIQAEQEARARAIASGAAGKELEIKIKIEDAELRMKGVHGEKQIAIAEEIAGYKQQLTLLEKQTKVLEEQAKKLKELDISRRPEITVEGPPRAYEAFGESKVEFIPKEKIKENAKESAQATEDAIWEAFARGTIKRRTVLDKEADWEKDRIQDQARAMDHAREHAIAENRRQWERMYDNIRDGAGEIFDAMLTKGKSVFSSLANFAQGLLQTILRNIFQNMVMGLAASSGILQRFLGGGGAAGGGYTQSGGITYAGGGGASGATMGMAGMGLPFLSKLFPGKGGGATQSGGITTFAGGGAAKGFAGSAAGQAMTGAGAMAGSMLAMDAFRRGSAFEGLAGGAMAGASIGTMIAPGVGTAIGAGVGAIAGLITGLFGGGAKRRAEEAAKRAAAQEAQKFAAPETVTRFGIAGGAGYSVETDLTGSIRGIGVTPTVVTTVNVQMIDAKHAQEAGDIIADTVSKRILTGGSYLADNIAWAAS
jgi:hypothetical protein